MPIFEYGCPSCGHRMEVLEKSSQAPVPSCPQCQQESMQKLLSGFSVGTSRPDTPACDSCPGAAGQSPCMGGQCPMA